MSHLNKQLLSYLIIWAIASLSGIMVSAQSVESLVANLEAVSNPTKKIDILLRLADKTVYSAPEKSIEYADKAVELALSENDDFLIAKSLNRLGSGFWSKGDLLLGLTNLRKSLEMAQEFDSVDLAARNQGFIGNLYALSGDEISAISYYKVALKNFLKTGNQNRIFAMNNNIGKSFLDSDVLDSARFYLYRADRELRESFFFFAPLLYFNIAELEFKSGNFKTADSILAVAFSEAERCDDDRAKTRILQTQGELDLLNNNTTSALEKATRALALARKTKVKELVKICSKTLSRAYANSGDYAKAYDFQMLSNAYADSLNNTLIKNQLALSKFNDEQYQIALLQQTNRLNEEKASNQLFTIVILAVAFFIAVVLVLLLISKNRQINEQQKKLLELDHFKTKMFAVVAHDLRSPINTVTQLTEQLFDNILTKDKFNQLLPPFRQKISNLNGIVDNLFEWARSNMKGQSLEASSIDCRQLVDELITSIQYRSSKKGITIENTTHEEVIVTSDRRFLVIILRNLLANAIKFSHESSKVEVHVEDNGAPTTIFSVKDFGVGMSEEQVQQLFTHNLTHHSGTSGELGSGFGLVACYDLVHRLGGEISAESEPNIGSTFSFSIPKK